MLQELAAATVADEGEHVQWQDPLERMLQHEATRERNARARHKHADPEAQYLANKYVLLALDNCMRRCMGFGLDKFKVDSVTAGAR